MASPIETIRKMLLAHQSDDSGAFRSAVEELIVEERRKHHHVVARDLARLLGGGGEVRRLRPFRTLHAWENDLPKDGDRGLSLLHAYEPTRRLDDLILNPVVRATIERFATEVMRGELLRAHGVAPPSRLLLCGPPGCGKTSLAEAISRELGLPLAVVRFDVVISSYLGETAANLRKIFDFVATRPMVVLFDEFDAIAKQRDDDFEHGELKRVVNAFLQLLDGLLGDNVIIAATNHHGLLDAAVWRRFDEILRLELPDPNERRDVLMASLHGMPLLGLPSWPELTERTVGMSHADLERIARMAVREAILNDETEVRVSLLEAAIARYQDRMAVVSRALTDRAPTHQAETMTAGTPPHAVHEGHEPAPASRDADPENRQRGTEAPTAAETTGARARAQRPARPRHRTSGGADSDGDETKGTGSGS